MSTWICVATLIIEVVLLCVCIVCEIMEAIYPETQAFEKVRIFVFLATLLIFPIILQFFGLFFDFSIIWDFIKDFPRFIISMFDMFRGCMPM